MMAERVRFELTVPEGTTLFESAPFNRSGISPQLIWVPPAKMQTAAGGVRDTPSFGIKLV